MGRCLVLVGKFEYFSDDPDAEETRLLQAEFLQDEEARIRWSCHNDGSSWRKEAQDKLSASTQEGFDLQVQRYAGEFITSFPTRALAEQDAERERQDNQFRFQVSVEHCDPRGIVSILLTTAEGSSGPGFGQSQLSLQRVD